MLILEAAELDLAGPIVDDRRLIERDVAQLGRVGQTARHDTEGRDRDGRGEPRDPDQHGRDDRDDRHDHAGRAMLGPGVEAAVEGRPTCGDDSRRTCHGTG